MGNACHKRQQGGAAVLCRTETTAARTFNHYSLFAVGLFPSYHEFSEALLVPMIVSGSIVQSIISRAMDSAALPYHEADIVEILILSSFLLLINLGSYVLDRIVYYGLSGQILIGVAWGTPGAQWLSHEVQGAIMGLGYLGLILIVYEDTWTFHGPSYSASKPPTLRANLLLSTKVAAVGICCPIGLSFILLSLLEVTPLQAFAAGAALCSTSLGTTFTVLTTSGLTESRLGVVLSSAAMMDDVAGLVMVQVISNLGQASFDAITVVRPILVSLAFAILLPMLCRWVVKPLTALYYQRGEKGPGHFRSLWNSQGAMFILQTVVLLPMVTGSSYAGTSNLFAAYLAGAAITWWSNLRNELFAKNQSKTGERSNEKTGTLDDQKAESDVPQGDSARSDLATNAATAVAVNPQQRETSSEPPGNELTGISIYRKYYEPAVKMVLKPFFFASIGFSIPISPLFTGGVVWRGLVYFALMAFGKLLCGACLIRFSGPAISMRSLKKVLPTNIRSCWPASKHKAIPSTGNTSTPATSVITTAPARTAVSASQQMRTKARTSSSLPRPRSLYPAAILGSAMVARGEIGFLISSVAESKGIFDSGSGTGSSECFLVVTWAILLCTILGPAVVGLLVKRVKRLQEMERSDRTGRKDPLGIWGVVRVS